jgi:hypothetical protein
MEEEEEEPDMFIARSSSPEVPVLLCSIFYSYVLKKFLNAFTYRTFFFVGRFLNALNLLEGETIDQG